jgi:DNA-directed RNA polymerase subunit RPC12/RpoP
MNDNSNRDAICGGPAVARTSVIGSRAERIVMLAGKVQLTPETGYRCPRCGAASGTLNLLTSMTRYYVCGRCACRWAVSRVNETRSRPGYGGFDVMDSWHR